MKNTIYILFLFILLNSCEELSNPFEDTHQNVVVKTQTKVLIDPSTNAEINKIFEKEFDKNGKIIKVKFFDNSSNVKSESNFEYEVNKKIEKVVEYNVNGDTNLVYSKEYKQNSSGQVLEIVKYDAQGNPSEQKQFKYDSQGNVSEEILISKDGSKVNEFSYDYIYKENGEVSSIYVRNDIVGDIIKKDSLVYNDNKVELISIDKDGKISQISQINYDQNGLIKSESKKNNIGEIIEKFIYKYQYY